MLVLDNDDDDDNDVDDNVEQTAVVEVVVAVVVNVSTAVDTDVAEIDWGTEVVIRVKTDDDDDDTEGIGTDVVAGVVGNCVGVDADVLADDSKLQSPPSWDSSASFPGVIGPHDNWHCSFGNFWLAGLVINVRSGGAGNLYHLKSGFAFRKASLYCLASSVYKTFSVGSMFAHHSPSIFVTERFSKCG